MINSENAINENLENPSEKNMNDKFNLKITTASIDSFTKTQNSSFNSVDSGKEKPLIEKNEQLKIQPIKLLNDQPLFHEDYNCSFIKYFDFVQIIKYDNEEKYECSIFLPKEYDEIDDFINDIKNKNYKLIKKDFELEFEFEYKTLKINKRFKRKKIINYENKIEEYKNEIEKKNLLIKELKDEIENKNQTIKEIKKQNQIERELKNMNQNKKDETQIFNQSKIILKEQNTFNIKDINKEYQINDLAIFPSGNIIIAERNKILLFSKDFKKLDDEPKEENQSFLYVRIRDENNFLSYSKDKKKGKYKFIIWKKDQTQNEKKFKKDKEIENENINNYIIFVKCLSNGDFISCSRNKNDDELQDTITKWNKKIEKEENHPRIESLLIIENKNIIISVGGNDIFLWDLSLKQKKSYIDNDGGNINFKFTSINLLNDNKFIVDNKNKELQIYELQISEKVNKFKQLKIISFNKLILCRVIREINFILIVELNKKDILFYFYDLNGNRKDLKVSFNNLEEKEIDNNNSEIVKYIKKNNNRENIKSRVLKNKEFLLYGKEMILKYGIS